MAIVCVQRGFQGLCASRFPGSLEWREYIAGLVELCWLHPQSGARGTIEQRGTIQFSPEARPPALPVAPPPPHTRAARSDFFRGSLMGERRSGQLSIASQSRILLGIRALDV